MKKPRLQDIFGIIKGIDMVVRSRLSSMPIAPGQSIMRSGEGLKGLWIRLRAWVRLLSDVETTRC